MTIKGRAVFGILLGFALALGLVPGMSATAYAGGVMKKSSGSATCR